MTRRLLVVALALAGAMLCAPVRADVANQWDGTIVSSRHISSHHFVDANKMVAGRIVGARPAGCPRAWCGCWLGKHLGLRDRKLWLARNWLQVGRRISVPQPGAVAVFARGRTGGHVGIVKRVLGPGKIVLLSGNDGGAVRERPRSTRGVLGYVVL